MRFIINKGAPYLVNGGKAYPVEIKDGIVRVDESNGIETTAVGAYTLEEVTRKLGNCSSIPAKKRTKKETDE